MFSSEFIMICALRAALLRRHCTEIAANAHTDTYWAAGKLRHTRKIGHHPPSVNICLLTSAFCFSDFSAIYTYMYIDV